MSGSDKRLRKKENARAAREAREAAVKRTRRNRLLIRFAVLVAVFAIVVGVVSVVNDDDTDPGGAAERCVDTVPEPNPANDLQRDSAPPLEIDQEKTYVATVSTTCGDFEVQLDAQNAPNTVNSFVYLANQGFYDGLTFHRLVDDFVIQGGDPNGDGSGDPGYATPDEPPLEGYRRGSVAMANSGPNTSGSQFFVVLSQNGAENLGGPPYAYSILGQVTSGIDVVDLLASFVNPDENEVDISTQVPTRDLYIFSVEIDES